MKKDSKQIKVLASSGIVLAVFRALWLSRPKYRVMPLVLSAIMLSPLLEQAAYAAPVNVIKTTSTAAVVAGGTATYTITASNPLSSGSAITDVSIKDDLPVGFTYKSASAPQLNSCATRTAIVDPAIGAVNPTWGTFSIPVNCTVSITFVADVDPNTTPLTYQNSARIFYTTGASAATDSYGYATSTLEDVTVSSNSLTVPSVTFSAPSGSACATPGKDGTPATNPSGVINTYYPSTSVSTDKKSITVGSAAGPTSTIVQGDLLLIIQMQDATIDASNTANYGSTNNNGSGVTALNFAGAYEYAVAGNTVIASGGTLQLVSPLTHTYTNADATSTQGQKRFQVIRVPQYQNLTLSSAVTAYPWDGTKGGVVVLDVSRTLTFSSGKIVATGAGFRGGGGKNTGGVTASANVNKDYVSLSTAGYHGSKGEGIAGTPISTRSVVSIAAGTGAVTANTGVNTGTAEGYPNGSFARGAPGNAGGGGTDPNQGTNAANTGGGGGANYGSGGKGGDSWYDGFSRRPFGGVGGSAFPTSVNALVMGGGGGAGTSNNSSSGDLPSGGSGGGIVLIRAKTIAGSGSIEANGIAGLTPSGTDGAGAGGAGGTILIQATQSSSPTLSISANGGNGANSGYWDHGPGGGGGGGYVAYQGFTVNPVINGGSSGNDKSGSGNGYGYVDPNENSSPDPYGATGGSGGLGESSIVPTAGVAPGAVCGKPNILLVKRITSIQRGTSAVEQLPLSYIDLTNDANDNAIGWPTQTATAKKEPIAAPDTSNFSTLLQGIVTTNIVQPKDTVEYRIYFLSSGTEDAQKVSLCDFIPANSSYVSGSTQLVLGTTTTAISDVTIGTDTDGGFYPSPATVSYPAACTGTNYSTGAVLVNIGSVLQSTGIGAPANSYGYIRFQTKIN
jgi:uncharacterized repeat protein (TIGR01451 family)